MSVDKKIELRKEMEPYVDDHRCIDISKFRKENPKIYALLPHYYGSVSEAIEENGWVKVGRREGQTPTLKNQLAYEMLKELREKQGVTLQKIAEKHGVSRAAINQLYQALKSTIENKEVQ
jgi:coproporphyrinogen III oxidase-like Fe-S oxidoreductase